jgi:nucleotide-binding universal stress UspA family protein
MKETTMNILVGYEKSEVAQEALELAIVHAKAFGGKIHVFTSMQGGPSVPREDFVEAEKHLKTAKEHVEISGIECVSKLSVRGLQPGEDIVQYAEEKDVDKIIIGVKRRSKVGKLVFGSNAQYVILEAHCPVLSVK